MHIYRWDLDRTYLETEISTVRGLVRAAFEAAADKRTVPGAAALLQGLVEADPQAMVSILSGSPEQMRDVLLQKLALDGVRVDRLILKDNLGNLRRGRLRAVRGQIGYKLPHLLEDREKVPADATETLFGDDAEADALIYAAYAAVLAGELDEAGLIGVLRLGDAYPDAVDRAVAAARRLRAAPPGPVVTDIFIRIDRGVPVGVYKALGPLVKPVFSWFQAALALFVRGSLGERALGEVARASAGETALHGLVVDAVRRGVVDRDRIEAALAVPALAAVAVAARPAIGRIGPVAAAIPRAGPPDFAGFYSAVRGWAPPGAVRR